MFSILNNKNKKFSNKSLKKAVKLWNESLSKAENKYGAISEWDVSGVTSMRCLFMDSEVYGRHYSMLKPEKKNMDLARSQILSSDKFSIANWDVSNVVDMAGMFKNAQIFNSDISKWDVSKVTNMTEMFCDSYHFNQDISKWDVSKVINMVGMFMSSYDLDKLITEDDLILKISNLSIDELNSIRQELMYTNFNQDISSWNVSSVKYMTNMFYGAKLPLNYRPGPIPVVPDE